MSLHHPLRELYLSRLREFYRQPARIFWVYGFPTVLAIGLGLAFRSRPTESIQVDVVSVGASSPVEKTLRDYDAKARREGRMSLLLRVEPAEEAARRLRTGKTPLVVEPKGSRVVYRYDPTRPEAVAAKGAIDDILQAAAGRKDPVDTEEEKLSEPGSRYIDFLIPGLIGLNTMGGGL